jgi:hypothetical protein
MKGRDYSEDLGIDRKRVIEWILGKCGGNAWDGFMWLRKRAVVNTVMNLRVPTKAGNLLSS